VQPVMASVLLVIMGLTGLGTAVKFILRPVVIGFTNGIAVLIASTQVTDFFGLHLDKVPGVFWQRMEALAASFHTLSWEATGLAVFTLLMLIFLPHHLGPYPGTDPGIRAGNDCRLRLQTAGGNDRYKVWWDSCGPAAFATAKIPH
jgi:MFS superfamily sulfate permease-like transporter